MYIGRMAEPDLLGAELLSAVARVNRWATSLAEFPISSAQARLLALVDAIGPARISDLAKADHCTQPTMTFQMQRLEESGWVTREADPADARAVLITLSRQGANLLRNVRLARVRSVAPALAALDDDQVARLREAVSTLEELLVVAGQAAGLQEVH